MRADDALGRLREGNARYAKGRQKHPNAAPKRRAEIAAHQKPFAVVLSCADSRVPPEIVFDQGLGDLFVVRTAGHAIGAIELASIEYAVEHLGASLILVLGHERCGAIKATVDTLHPPHPDASPRTAAAGRGRPRRRHTASRPEPAAHGDAHGDAGARRAGARRGRGGPRRRARQGRPTAHWPTAPPTAAPITTRSTRPTSEPRDHIHLLVELLKPAVQAVEGRVAPGELVDAAVNQNVRMVVARLVRDSPLVKSFLVAGRIRIAGARYDLDTGEIKMVR